MGDQVKRIVDAPDGGALGQAMFRKSARGKLTARPTVTLPMPVPGRTASTRIGSSPASPPDFVDAFAEISNDRALSAAALTGAPIALHAVARAGASEVNA